MERECHHGFACSEHDDEQCEDLTGRATGLRSEVIERDEVERPRIEDQLDAEEHPDRVPPRGDGEECVLARRLGCEG